MSARPDLPPLPALVTGTVRHDRRAPLVSGFVHRAYLWLVDVDALPDHGPLARFRAADHLGDPAASLRENVTAFLRAQGEDLEPARVLMLAGARVAGYVFDPLSLFWCLDDTGAVRCVVAEVHNTYGERHAYLLHPDPSGRAETDKAFHVSPFLDVSGRYRLRIVLGPDRVAVAIRLQRPGDDEPVLSASFDGVPRPATRAQVLRTAVRLPLMPQRVTALIHAHGVALWARRLPVQPRTTHRPPVGVEPEPRAPWDAVGPARRVPVRAAVARRLVARACAAAGVALVEDGQQAPPGPALVIRPAAYHRLAAHPKLGLAQAWIAREWDVAEGCDLADVLARFAGSLEQMLPPWAWRLRRLTDTALPETARNDPGRARRNISAHYDLSNELFALFLDPSMTYSSALFDDPEEDLEVAQARKLDAVLDLAGVRAGSEVLEIGTGWGSLAIRAARRGARVVSLTLSAQQRGLALRRAREAGVEIDVRLADYREAGGRFDAVVSVEMIEAVGEEFWPAYLRTIDERLRPGGRAAIQAITMSHERMLATRHSHGWVQEYVFPGGLIPSVQALREAAAEHTALRLEPVRAFGPDYARTLRRWRRRFTERSAEVAQAGFGDRFQRLWELYLAYSEAGFASGYLQVEHLLLEKPADGNEARTPVAGRTHRDGEDGS